MRIGAGCERSSERSRGTGGEAGAARRHRASELVELSGVTESFHGVAVAVDLRGLELRQGFGAVFRKPIGTVFVDRGLELADASQAGVQFLVENGVDIDPIV